jgi:hypothetical protein
MESESGDMIPSYATELPKIERGVWKGVLYRLLACPKGSVAHRMRNSTESILTTIRN